MYIISLTYKVPLENIDQHLEEHVSYLNEQYANGIFLMSGKKVPRSGGVILAKSDSKSNLLSVIDQDPFKTLGLAYYEIIEFEPSKTHEELKFLMD